MLNLWQVSLPVDDDFDKQLENLVHEGFLPSVKKLGPLFSDEMMEENIHIVVKPPPLSEFIYLYSHLI